MIMTVGTAFRQHSTRVDPGVGSRQSTAGFLLMLGSATVYIWASFDPQSQPAQNKLASWLGVVGLMLAFQLLREIEWRAVAGALVIVELVVLVNYFTAVQHGGVNAIWVGRVVMLAGLFAFLAPQRGFTRWIVLFLHLAVLLEIGKQGPLIGFLAGVLVYAAFAPSIPRRLFLGIAFLALSAAIFLTRLYGVLSSEIDDQGTASARVELWRFALSSWNGERLFGNGFGSFYVTNGFHLFPYPHNVFLEALAELGIIGLALLAACAYFGLRRAQNPRVVAVFATALVAAQVSGSIPGNHEMWLIIATCGLLRDRAKHGVPRLSAVPRRRLQKNRL